MDKFKAYYKDKLVFTPYDYQIRVAETLLSGKNVVLSVPTGAGKTWASVMPFLYAREYPEIHFPKKLIYNLPLRALTNSIYEDVCMVADSSIQTGEYSEDKYFEKDIIFSTIDQTLSNFLCFPLALSQRQANINAGALVGSYLVFDEFHLLDSGLSMATTLGMLRILDNLSRFCIMTATLSSPFMNALKENLNNCEIITLDNFEDDKQKIGSLKPSKEKKKLEVLVQTISSEKILKEHKSKSIVLCNRVETVQRLYNEIVAQVGESTKMEVLCLHSRFFGEDRKIKEDKLKKLFGKDADQHANAILISTQVIEAGMDISCEVMHTEVSPVNSFLQRAGRCARFAGQTGQIFVYDVLGIDEKEKIKSEPVNEDDKKEIRQLNNKYLPYGREICEATYATLQKYKTLDGSIPEKLVEMILGEKEKDVINQLQIVNFNRQKILDSWLACQKNHYCSTVRDIQNVEIVIVDESKLAEVSEFPYRYQSLGLYKWSLVGWLNKIACEDGDWMVKCLEEEHDLFLENDESSKLTLKTISPDEYRNLPTQVYVNAKYFGYSPDFGFNRQYSETFGRTSPKRELKQKETQLGILKKDSFYQHNKALIGAFEDSFLGNDKSGLDFIFGELGSYIDNQSFQKEDFNKLITLMLVLHDYGKLNETWQKPMQCYQAKKEGMAFEKWIQILGHTDYDGNSDSDNWLAKQTRLFARPAHAGVGAYVAQELLPELYGDDYLTSSISTAISRHHSPLSKSFPDFKIPDKYYREMERLLSEFGWDIELEREYEEGELNGFEFDDWEREQVLYLFFVRILRLCDQKATENFEKYFKEQNYV